MNEEDFLREHPSCKEILNCLFNGKDRAEGSICPKCNSNHTISFELFQSLAETQLDKQKVIKAFNKVMQYIFDAEGATLKDEIEMFNKELGLE